MKTLIALLLTTGAASADGVDWSMVDFDTIPKTPIVERAKPATGFIGNVHGTDYVGPDYAVTSFETVNWGRK